MRTRIVVSVVTAIVTGLAAQALAVDPVGAYEARRKAAEEKVRIKIAKVVKKDEKSDGGQIIEVTATVISTERSKSKLAKGDEITIRWWRPVFREGGEVWTGSWASPPTVDREYTAFLNKAGKNNLFKPAAQHRSFD